VPGNGDTVTISHNVTLTGNVTVGSSPSTGGTAAIAFGSVTGKTLAIGAFRLICKGDISGAASYNGTNTITGGAGGRLTFLPASGQQYGFLGVVGSGLHVNLTGTSGSHFVLDTDKSSSGLSAVTDASTGFNKKILFNLAYVDVTDFGTTSGFGIANRVFGANNVSVTNCTFTRSSYSFQQADSPSAWSGNLTFEDNEFADSVAVTSGSTRNVDFNFIAGLSGTVSIQRNGFDETIRFSDFAPTVTFAHNAHEAVTFNATSSWASADRWHHNFAFVPAGFEASVTVYGPMRDCFIAADDATNPAFFYGAPSLASMSLLRCIFEATNTSNDGEGDANAAGPAVQSIKNCLVLATHGTTVSAGTLLTVNVASGGQAITVEHNTVVGAPTNGAINYAEATSTAEAGQLASVKSNLFVNLGAAGATTFKVFDVGHQTTGGVEDVLSPANGDYNASLNYRLTPQAGNSYTNANNGYQGNFSAVPGTNDITISADPFVDSTRNLRTWGASKGTDGSLAAAVALVKGDPTLIAEADTGLLDWVFAGFAVNDAALQDAGHDAVTIGAMEFEAPSSPSTSTRDRQNKYLRPFCPPILPFGRRRRRVRDERDATLAA
jgi:hypothetical protein